MTNQRTPTPHPPEAGRYEIRLTGRLDAHWAAWFDGLTVSHESDGTTVLRGPIADQAALHGVLQRVRDLGLPLVSVTCVDANQTKTTDTNHTPAAHQSTKGNQT
jgi:hypothetical protein